MIIYRPITKLGDTFIGDVCEYDEEALMLRGCGHRTDTAKSWQQAEREALAFVNWS